MRRTSRTEGNRLYWLLSIVIVMVAEMRGTTVGTVHARCSTPERLPRRGTRLNVVVDLRGRRSSCVCRPFHRGKVDTELERAISKIGRDTSLRAPPPPAETRTQHHSFSLTSPSCARAGDKTERSEEQSVRAIAASVTSGASGKTPERPAHSPSHRPAPSLSCSVQRRNKYNQEDVLHV